LLIMYYFYHPINLLINRHNISILSYLI